MTMEARHKWVRDSFKRYGKWWERYRSMTQIMDKEGKKSWIPTVEEDNRGRKRVVTFTPVSPRR